MSLKTETKMASHVSDVGHVTCTCALAGLYVPVCHVTSCDAAFYLSISCDIHALYLCHVTLM